MIRTVGDFIFHVLSLIGALTSIFAYYHYIGPKLNDQGVAGVVFLGMLCVVFFAYTGYLIVKYRDKVRYFWVFKDLNIGFSAIHALDRHSDTKLDDVLNSLAKMCDSMSEAFSKINGHHIGVCIKYLEEEGKHSYVTTLVRDKKSRSNGRKTGTADKIKHWLTENADFKFLFYNFEDDNIDTSCYYRTKLPLREDYLNSRLNGNWPPNKIFILNNLNRQKQWPLNYRCTIVVPIVPLNADEQSRNPIRGFLCMDSPKNKAFYKEADAEILRGIADAVYNKIDYLTKI